MKIQNIALATALAITMTAFAGANYASAGTSTQVNTVNSYLNDKGLLQADTDKSKAGYEIEANFENIDAAIRSNAAAIDAANDDIESLGNKIAANDTWTDTKAYTPGDLVIKNGQLYKCTADNTAKDPTEPGNASYWETTSVGEQMAETTGTVSQLNENLIAKENIITYPNYADELTTLSFGQSYTATKKCWAVGYIKNASSGYTVHGRINDYLVASAFGNNSVCAVCVPLNINDTFKTTNTGGSGHEAQIHIFSAL